MIEFQVIPAKDFSNGEDAKSVPSSILQGYCESLLNVETNSSGWVGTRKGYQGYFGWVPIRVQSVTHSGTSIRFTLGPSDKVGLNEIGTMPLIAYGKVSEEAGAPAGDFTPSANSVQRYYSSCTLSSRYPLSDPSGTVTVTAAELGHSSIYLFANLLAANYVSGFTYQQASTTAVTIDGTTFSTAVDYDYDGFDEGFLYYLERNAEAGVTYVSQRAAETSASFTAATHGIASQNLIVRCFDTGTTPGSAIAFTPSAVSISSTGTVSITYGTTFTGDVVITKATHSVESVSTAAGGHTTYLPFDSVPWIFASAYKYNTSTGAWDEAEIISLINAGAASVEAQVTAGGAGEVYRVDYLFGQITPPVLTVTDTSATSESYTDTEPQITIWGLPHAELYSGDSESAGHVTHLDTYKRVDELRAICGLGGNLYAARTAAEVGTTYGMPTLYPNMRARVDGATVLGPLFYTSGTPTRTRGYVTDASITDNLARVTAAAFLPEEDEQVAFTLSFTNKTGSIVLNTDVAESDSLTVSGLSTPEYNGTFRIVSIASDSATEATIWCSVPGSFTSDFDEAGADGRAGVFTDKFSVEAAPDLIVGDRIRSAAIDSDLELLVDNYASTTVTVSGVTELISLPDAAQLYIGRTSDVVPLRLPDLTRSVEDLVRGDMLEIAGLDRQVRVVHINPDADNAVDVVVASNTAAVTTNAAHHLNPGQKFILTGTGVIDGVHTITTVDAADSFNFAVVADDAELTGNVVGYTVELDEELAMEDEVDAASFAPVGRWIPIELPARTISNEVLTRTQHLDTNEITEQNALRSTIISDTMYFTNGDDEVLKFDGDSVYQAGLIPWQAQLFAAVDTGTGSITIETTSSAWTAKSGNKYTIGLGDALGFNVGDRIQDSQDSAIYTILQTSDDGTNDFVYVDRAITGTGSGTLSKVARYRYYFRLNAIDANNNIVASAATGANDFHVEISVASQIKLRLIGLPLLGDYDYDRIEIQVYRTKAGTAAPYYLIRSVPLPNDLYTNGYIDIVDGTPDELLRDFDVVNTALKGAEVGTAWNLPPRAKAVTSAGNRLILTNIKDYPEIDITFRRKSSAASIVPADLDQTVWLFRKDNTDAGTTTDNINRMAFEFVDGGAVTLDPATDISRDATSITIAENSHGLVAGNWVYLFHNAAPAANTKLDFAGWFQVGSADANTFSVWHTNTSTAAATDINAYVCATTKTNVPVWLGNDGNYNWVGANPSTSYEFIAALRMANAINAVQRKCHTVGFVPWMMARAGSEYGVGQLVVRQPKVQDTTMELLLPTISGTYEVFVNSILRASAAQVSAQTKIFPSRVVLSYPGYPEVFDDPFGNSGDGDSAVDINAADGQEAVISIPFSGSSTFGQGQTESKIIVLKSDSLYQLDLMTLQYQEIKQPYGGCTIPGSVTQTKDGITFANDTGMYRLNHDMSVVPFGEMEERNWKQDLNRDQLHKAAAHNFRDGNKYKLSVPGIDSDTNSFVFVYDHANEGKKQPYGAWTRHDNFNATGWANLGRDSLFATADGQVFKMRNVGDNTDYRDDAAGIAAEVVTRSSDFDMPGVNKIVSGVLVEFHNDSGSLEGIQVSTATDSNTEFQNCDTFTVESSSKTTESAWFSLARRKCGRIQTKIACSTKDAPFVIAGMAYRVGALDVKGTPEAADL